VAYVRSNVKLAAAYSGLSESKDGPTHHSVCAIVVMRALPNMTVVVATDAVEALKLVPAVVEFGGPVYLRLSRAEVPVIYTDHHTVEIGKEELLQDGTH